MRKLSVVTRDDMALDLECYDESVTVQDLADAIQWTADDQSLIKELRTWPHRTSGTCYGCTHCCERFGIYLTNIDVQSLALHFGVSTEEFLAYATRYEPWKVNRVRLSDPAKLCISEDGCSLYSVRPLICRLYICASVSPALRQAIAEINALGEAALVNMKIGAYDSSNPFSDKFNYSQIPLRDCLSDDVWKAIFVGEYAPCSLS